MSRSIVAALVVAALLAPAVAPARTTRAGRCHTQACKVRVRARWAHDRMVRVVAPYRARFLLVASCESGRRWHIATGNGFYGGLQFTLSSWWAVGGRGYPHQASQLEQLYRGVRLLHLQGWGAWPNCG